jgi:D-alanine-D-alanine ligase
MSKQRQREDVLIIHQATADKKFACQESNAGVIEEVNAVAIALEKSGIKYQIESIAKIEQLPKILSRCKQKIIFNLVEELPGRIVDACYVPAICHSFGRVCTGSDTSCLILAQNKWRTKTILEAAKLPCPKGTVAAVGQKICLEDLTAGKYIVKPVFSDASEGIGTSSVVDLPGAALEKAIKKIHKQFGQPAIVEQFIPDRELNVSVLEQNGKADVLAIAEIDFSAFDKNSLRIVDYSAKWQPDSFAYNNTPRILPAKLSDKQARLVRQYSLAAWEVLGCQDYARVDFRMDKNGQPFILEINPNPDISPDAGFAAAVTAAGLTYEKFVRILLDNALSRY